MILALCRKSRPRLLPMLAFQLKCPSHRSLYLFQQSQNFRAISKQRALLPPFSLGIFGSKAGPKTSKASTRIVHEAEHTMTLELVVLSAMITSLGIVATGYASRKFGVLEIGAKQSMAHLSARFFIPCLLFSRIVGCNGSCRSIDWTSGGRSACRRRVQNALTRGTGDDPS